MESNRPDPIIIKPQIEELSLEAKSFYDLAEHFCVRPHFAFLDTRSPEARTNGHSFLTFSPYQIVRSKGDRAWTTAGGKELDVPAGVFDALEQALGRFQISSGEDDDIAPFLGGAIGYFGYELSRRIETLPSTAVDIFNLPDCYFCFYHFVIVLSHETGRVYLSYFDPWLAYFDPWPAGATISKQAILDEIESAAAGGYRRDLNEPFAEIVREPASVFQSDFSREAYQSAVNRIKEYIFAGDVYQVNLTQRFQADLGGLRPWRLYKQLMELNPAPFAAFLNLEGFAVLSSSPELFLRVREGRVQTRPIKGTIARGSSQAIDDANRERLFNSVKNRAELAMIVDLLRNDLGRVCKTGSVKVGAFPELETHPSVHHLAATVTGDLPDGLSIMELIKAAFPGGSITGAPKIRAMEIIDELEPVGRGVYTGSIGYLGFNRRADFNIVIRTILVKDGSVHIQAGGGVVIDSVDAEEYDETLLKAQKLFSAVLSLKP